MTATTILIRLLVENSTVASIAGDRIFGVQRPQNSALPAIVVTPVYEDQDVALDGHREAYTSRMEVQCVGSSVVAADVLAEAVKGALAVANTELLNDDSPPAVEALVQYVIKNGAEVFDYTETPAVFRRLMDFNLRWSIP